MPRVRVHRKEKAAVTDVKAIETHLGKRERRRRKERGAIDTRGVRKKKRRMGKGSEIAAKVNTISVEKIRGTAC